MLGFGNGPRHNAEQKREQVLSSILTRLEALESAPRLPQLNADHDTRLGTLETGFDRLNQDFKSTTFAVAEGIERVDRSERRIHATVKRARAELKKLGYEDPGLEAEASQLREVDGEGSHGTEVLHLPEDVAPAPEAPSSVPGVPASTLARIRSY